jgi:hypothetical protein
MKEPSASNAGLAALCAHPWTSGIAWPADRGSSAGDLGRSVHRGAEALVTREPVFPGVFAGLSESERESLVGHVRQAADFLTRVRPDVRTEAAELRLRYDVDAGRASENPPPGARARQAIRARSRRAPRTPRETRALG